MDIELSRLTSNDLELRGSVALPEEGEPGQTLAADGIRFPDAFLAEIRARRNRSDVIVVAGHVEGVASLQCGRCLEWFPHPLSFDMESRFCEAGSGPARAAAAGRRGLGEDDDSEPRLPAEDDDLVELAPGTRALHVGDVVREQVLVELPFRPLCRPDCAGLCPRCGGNRNEGACRCGAAGDGESSDPRLAALAELKKKLERH